MLEALIELVDRLLPDTPPLRKEEVALWSKRSGAEKRPPRLILDPEFRFPNQQTMR